MDIYKQDIIDEETISAISAAIAFVVAGTGNRLVIRNIKRLPQTAPVWNSAGRLERLKNDMNS